MAWERIPVVVQTRMDCAVFTCRKCGRSLPCSEFLIRKGESSPARFVCHTCRAKSLQRRRERRERKKAARINERLKTAERRKCGNGRDYASRDKWLTTMGFASYREYLKSETWKSIRKRVLDKHNRRCAICSGYASHVHHNRYHINDLTGSTLDFLVALCGDCHRRIEFDGDRKRTLKEVKRTLGSTIDFCSNGAIRAFLEFDASDNPALNGI